MDRKLRLFEGDGIWAGIRREMLEFRILPGSRHPMWGEEHKKIPGRGRTTVYFRNGLNFLGSMG